MAEFRYAQFCPLSRAVEILGERWTVLIVRELFFGPKRFSDLKAALNGVSSSVLADRLARMEERSLVRRNELPPPAASSVYELAEAGLALRPVLVELMRWGVRFLDAPGAGDCVRPEWLLLGLDTFARRGPCPEVTAKLRAEAGAESLEIYVEGSDAGVVVSHRPLPYDVAVTAAPVDLLMFAAGVLAADDPRVHIEGDATNAAAIPRMFEFRPTTDASPLASLTQQQQGANR